MRPNDYKELLSIVYLSGIMAEIGGVTECSWRLVDNMGIDVECHFWNVFDDLPPHTRLDIQLKSTSHPEEYADYYVERLNNQQFKKYCALSCDGNDPFYVFLFVLPPDTESDTWIVRYADHMIVKGQMYWAPFNCDDVEDQAMKLVFPKQNIVNAESVRQLLLHYREEHRGGFSDAE